MTSAKRLSASAFKIFISLALAAGLSLPVIPAFARDAYAQEASAQPAGDYEPTELDYQLASLEPSSENSYRYSNGQPIRDLAAVSDASAGGLSLKKVVTSGGITYYDAFDTFKRGHCSGIGAYRGIDVSEHQGTMDWSKTSKAIDFAIIRCGFGSNTSGRDDKQWTNNVNGCIKNKVPFGVYIYSYATTISGAESEAKHVLRCLKNAGLGPSDLAYPVYFDMEDASTIGKNLSGMANKFLSTVSEAGYAVGVYSSTSWWENYLTAKVFDNYYKWIAQYNTTMGLTYSGAANFEANGQIWQFSSMGKLPGISANTVDMNYTYMEPNAVETMTPAYTAPSTPHQESVRDGEYLIYSQAATTMTATVKDGSKDNNANVHLAKSDMTSKQRFRVERDGSTGFYTIKSSSSGHALGLVRSGDIYLTNVAQHTYDASDVSQKWIISSLGGMKYSIKNAANPSYVLHITSGSAHNGANIQVKTSNGASTQKWGFVSTTVNVGPSTANVKSGLYTLALSKKTSRAIEVDSASTSNGANIRLHASDKSARQKFYVKSDGDGYYHITSLVSGKAIEPELGNLVYGTNVHQNAYNRNSLAQKWSISRSGSGYKFTSAANGQALEVAAGSTKKKANVQTNAHGATTAQAFSLKKITAKKSIKNGTYRLSLARNKSLSLDISKKSKAKARLGSTSKTKSQRFRFKYNKSTGFYTIRNARSGKVLELANNKCVNKKRVRQNKANGGMNQMWIVTKAGKGRIHIKSALDPAYLLDAGKGAATSKSKVKIYKKKASRNQTWSAKRI